MSEVKCGGCLSSKTLCYYIKYGFRDKCPCLQCLVKPTDQIGDQTVRISKLADVLRPIKWEMQRNSLLRDIREAKGVHFI